LWEKLQLDVQKGGVAAAASYGAALTAGDSIEFGEHVKLLITSPTLNLNTEYNVAIKVES